MPCSQPFVSRPEHVFPTLSCCLSVWFKHSLTLKALEQALLYDQFSILSI